MLVRFTPEKVGMYILHLAESGKELVCVLGSLLVSQRCSHRVRTCVNQEASPLVVNVKKQQGRVVAEVQLPRPNPPCPECGQKGFHESTCSQYIDNCELCGERVRRCDMERHLERWCLQRAVDCVVCGRAVVAAEYSVHMDR